MQLILNSYPGLEIRAGSAFDLVFDNTDPSSNPWGEISGVLLGKYQVIGEFFSTHKIFSQSPERLFLAPKSSSALEHFYRVKSISVLKSFHYELLDPDHGFRDEAISSWKTRRQTLNRINCIFEECWI